MKSWERQRRLVLPPEVACLHCHAKASRFEPPHVVEPDPSYKKPWVHGPWPNSDFGHVKQAPSSSLFGSFRSGCIREVIDQLSARASSAQIDKEVLQRWEALSSEEKQSLRDRVEEHRKEMDADSVYATAKPCPHFVKHFEQHYHSQQQERQEAEMAAKKKLEKQLNRWYSPDQKRAVKEQRDKYDRQRKARFGWVFPSSSYSRTPSSSGSLSPLPRSATSSSPSPSSHQQSPSPSTTITTAATVMATPTTTTPLAAAISIDPVNVSLHGEPVSVSALPNDASTYDADFISSSPANDEA